MRDEFEQWLLDNWGFMADQVTPICNTPPLFVLPNGFFDVAACRRWVDLKRAEWLRSIPPQSL